MLQAACFDAVFTHPVVLAQRPVACNLGKLVFFICIDVCCCGYVS
jgi:hypothetical protein